MRYTSSESKRVVSGQVAMLLVVCQLRRDVIGYEDSKCDWCLSIRLFVTVKQSFIDSQTVSYPVRQSVVGTVLIIVDCHSVSFVLS